MKAEIIAVGNEVLSGDIVNTNTAFLARRLSQMGFTVHKQCVVGDNAAEILEATKTAVARSHIIIFCGGLGPTKDDMTKEVVAKGLGLRLVKSQAVEDHIRSFFTQRTLPMTENNLKQAIIIEGSRVLHNENGTAPGLMIRSQKQAVVLLPGPPRELEPMFEKEVSQRLEKFADTRIAHRALHVFGIGESALETQVKDLLYSTNPYCALYAKTGEVQISVTARAKTVESANEMLKVQVAQFRDRLGDQIYSEDDKELHETVVQLLQDMNVRIAVAESCTGGLMASRITAVNGASRIFDLGVASYSDRAKEQTLGVDATIVRKYTAVSSAVAAEMAKGALLRAKAGVGVGITGIAGPTNEGYMDKPVGLVYIAVADKHKVLVKKFNFGNMRGRDVIRELCVLNAFDMVRRFVTGLPIEDVRQFSAKELAELEREGKPRNKSSLKVEKGIVSMLCALVLLTGGYFGVNAIRAKVQKNIYNELKTTYSGSVDMSARLTALVERNPDTVGWLSVDGTTLDSVVVKNHQDGYYDTHDFDGASNSLGCPYLPNEVDLVEEPRNLVVYGKVSDTSQLFSSSRSYSDPLIVRNNYLVRFENIYGSHSYKIASVMLANTNEALGDVQRLYEQVNFETTEAFQEFVIDLKMRSLYSIDTEIRSTDSFLTIVTELADWDGARLVIVARRVRDGETVDVTPETITPNKAALYPEAYYAKTGTAPVLNVAIERDRWLNWLVANDKNADNPNDSTTGGGSSGGFLVEEGTAGGSSVMDGKTVITVTMNGKTVTGTPVDIVSQIVAAEMSASSNDEAVKAQAVATISWLRYSYATNSAPAVSGGNPTERFVELVTQVINEAMFYDGAVAFTPYFAVSAGKTNSAEEIFGKAFPYLVSVESRYDYQATGYNRETTFSSEALKTSLESAYNITLSGNASNWIKILSMTSGGYVNQVSIDGQVTVSGYELAQTLALRSSCFTVSNVSSHIVFKTLGFGHGVGMSQAGANEYAIAQKWTYRQILEHYYPGVTFETIEW